MAATDNPSNVAFLFLFLVYSVQLVFVQRKLRRPESSALRDRAPELWVYMAMSLIVPLLVSVLPDLISNERPSPLTGSQIVIVGSRFLVAYLVTIITLELALHAQAGQMRRPNPWQDLLLANLGFDIVSILVFQLLRAQRSGSSDQAPLAASTDIAASGEHTLLIVFFFMCAIPTILTGLAVVAGSYVALTERPANA